jgi:iron complex outermembrane receptor protein
MKASCIKEGKLSRAYRIYCGIFAGWISATVLLGHSPADSDVLDLPSFHVEGYRFRYSEDALPISTTYVDESSIRRIAQATLGETLGWEPGVSSTYFGPGASRPVIRGHEGKRVRVLQHGLGSADDSDSSPDHALSIDPMMIKEAKIIRGPAALSYGGSAIGGVVDVHTRSIPDRMPEGGQAAIVDARYASVAREKMGFASYTKQLAEHWALRVNAVHREAGDVRIPGDARSEYFPIIHLHGVQEVDEPGPRGILQNSGYRTQNFTIGASRIAPRFSTGAAFSYYESTYGVPFHVHAHDHDNVDSDVSDDPTVTIDMKQHRFDADTEWRNPFPGIRSFHWRLGYSEYEHAELEDGIALTSFDRKALESRGEFAHETFGRFDGAFGFQYALQEYRAVGQEVFTPATESNYGAVFYMSQWSAEPLQIQSGIRYEAQRIHLTDFQDERRSDDSIAGSLGLVVNLQSHWRIHLGLSAVERVPTATELYAAGPHAATQTYELGDTAIQRERSKGVELMLEGHFERINLSLTGYYQNYESFIYLQRIGFEIQGFPVYQYVQRQAEFYGAELDFSWILRNGEQRTQLRVTSDFVHATDTDTNLPIPRIPPKRIALRLEEQRERLSWGVELRHAFAQNRNQPHLEAPTPSHTLVNADLEYTFTPRYGRFLTVYLRASNLLNEEARLHTSFLKEVTPLPGRSISLGMRWEY